MTSVSKGLSGGIRDNAVRVGSRFTTSMIRSRSTMLTEPSLFYIQAIRAGGATRDFELVAHHRSDADPGKGSAVLYFTCLSAKLDWMFPTPGMRDRKPTTNS